MMSTPPPVPEETVWVGHPANLYYADNWILGILLLPFVVGLFIIFGIFISRARRTYIVTTRKVIFQLGLFAKSSNEIRIKDIRSINVTKRGISGLLGAGSVEFSSAATDRAEIIFTGVRDADRLRDIVRRLQDA